MNRFRRNMLFALGSLPVGFVAVPAFAQNKVPQPGTDYRVINPPLPPESKTRVQVIEFFWYSCPHCYAFEPIIEPWIKKLPADVMFTRIPAVFDSSWVPQAMLYYSLEAMGELDRMHGKVFDAIHQQHAQLANEGSIADFLEKNGVPRAKFVETYRSFTVQSKVLRGNQLLKAYNIDGVPALGIDGRYVTSPSMVANSSPKGGEADWMAASLSVTEYLVGEVRKNRKLK